MQEGIREADVEAGLVGTVGVGEDETNGESSINIGTLRCVKWVAGEKFLCNTGSPVWRSEMMWRCGMQGREGGSRQRGYDSCCCMAETYTILYKLRKGGGKG